MSVGTAIRPITQKMITSLISLNGFLESSNNTILIAHQINYVVAQITDLQTMASLQNPDMSSILSKVRDIKNRMSQPHCSIPALMNHSGWSAASQITSEELGKIELIIRVSMLKMKATTVMPRTSSPMLDASLPILKNRENFGNRARPAINAAILLLVKVKSIVKQGPTIQNNLPHVVQLIDGLAQLEKMADSEAISFMQLIVQINSLKTDTPAFFSKVQHHIYRNRLLKNYKQDVCTLLNEIEKEFIESLPKTPDAYSGFVFDKESERPVETHAQSYERPYTKTKLDILCEACEIARKEHLHGKKARKSTHTSISLPDPGFSALPPSSTASAPISAAILWDGNF